MIGIDSVGIGFAIGWGALLLGYHLGRIHEREGWIIWLDARIPRLKGQRPTKITQAQLVRRIANGERFNLGDSSQ